MNSKKNTKVMRVIARLNVGGPSIHTILLSHSLNRRGYRDVLVCGRVSESEGDMMYLAREKNVDPIIISELGRDIHFGNDLKSFFKLLKLMRREKPDIVHTHTAKAGALGRLAALIAGVPIRVHTFHGHIFNGYFNPRKAKSFLLIEKILAVFTDKIITVSETLRRDIVDNLKIAGEEKSAVIPLGLDLERLLCCEKLKGSLKRKLGLSDDTILVGIVGRLVPIKNHNMFLDVASTVLQEKREAGLKFLVVGDGECRQGLEDYAKKLGIEKDVIFTGWREDLAEVYADLDVVALTSLNEGTPVSLIEGMAAAKAVISTDVGGVKDLIVDDVNGLLARSDDVSDYSGKLLTILKDRNARIRLGLQGRESAKSKYGIDRLVEDIADLYEKCLISKKRTKN